MKIIVGTPRSGTSFIAQWYANETPNSVYHMPENLGEYFHPDFMDDNVDNETLSRIRALTSDSVFKLHTGTEMSKHIWDYVKDKPIILVKRKDVFGQFLSFGIGHATNKWVSFREKGNNGLTGKVDYKKEWFEDLENRLIEFKNKKLLVEKTIWFEDIPGMKPNGRLPIKQNIGNKIDVFNNKDEVIEWFEDFSRRTSLVNR